MFFNIHINDPCHRKACCQYSQEVCSMPGTLSNQWPQAVQRLITRDKIGLRRITLDRSGSNFSNVDLESLLPYVGGEYIL